MKAISSQSLFASELKCPLKNPNSNKINSLNFYTCYDRAQVEELEIKKIKLFVFNIFF
jgi:hypothetical protein